MRTAILTALLLIMTMRVFPASTCKLDASGVDTSLANSLGGPVLGEAIGQTFFAPESLLSSITVWRIASEDTNYSGWHLFVTRADSLGKPIPDSILLDGPTLVQPYGDGVHPTAFRFEFYPPYSLPGRGEYYFAIQATPCSATFNMLMTDHGNYSDGELWRNGRTYFSGCRLRDYPQSFPLGDLVFTIEFCEPGFDATATWGHVKARYR